MTIGERIKERAEGEPNTTPDWYANELYVELSDVAESRSRNWRTLFFHIHCIISREVSFL